MNDPKPTHLASALTPCPALPDEGQNLPTTPQALFALLTQHGISHDTVRHPALFTVEQSKELRGEIEGHHVKNLF